MDSVAFAIGVKAANNTAEPVRALWNQVARFEAASSMTGLNYPPHITLAVYDDIDPALLKAAVADAFAGASALSLTFARIDYFDTDPLVLWAVPSAHSGLTGAHRAVHARIDPRRCHPHYWPSVWVPHCTLGTKIKADRRAEAVKFAARPIQPFRVTFDVADCVSFPPVVVLEEQRLIRPAPRGPAHA
jgi:2'-5' RNA ligase